MAKLTACEGQNSPTWGRALWGATIRRSPAQTFKLFGSHLGAPRKPWTGRSRLSKPKVMLVALLLFAERV